MGRKCRVGAKSGAAATTPHELHGQVADNKAVFKSGSGEIGRHTILRGWRREAWGFKSPLPHHSIGVRHDLVCRYDSRDCLHHPDWCCSSPTGQERRSRRRIWRPGVTDRVRSPRSSQPADQSDDLVGNPLHVYFHWTYGSDPAQQRAAFSALRDQGHAYNSGQTRTSRQIIKRHCPCCYLPSQVCALGPPGAGHVG